MTLPSYKESKAMLFSRLIVNFDLTFINQELVRDLRHPDDSVLNLALSPSMTPELIGLDY